MQTVTTPKDVEYLAAVAIEDGAGIEATANRPKTIDGKTPLAVVTQVGCTPENAVMWLHSLSIDIYAGNGRDYARVWDAARRVANFLGSIDEQDNTAVWGDPDIQSIYMNPDPRLPDIPRVSITCVLYARGD